MFVTITSSLLATFGSSETICLSCFLFFFKLITYNEAVSNSDPVKVLCSISHARVTLKSRQSHARASKARFLGISHISQTSKASWFANVQTEHVQVVSSETRIKKRDLSITICHSVSHNHFKTQLIITCVICNTQHMNSICKGTKFCLKQ